MDLALNNLQRLICHKTQQTKPKPKPGHSGHLCILKLAEGLELSKKYKADSQEETHV